MTNCSAKVRYSLVKADLIPQLIFSLNPQCLPIAQAVDIHTSLLLSLVNSVCLATPDSLARIGIEDGNEHQAVHKTILKHVVVPSENPPIEMAFVKGLLSLAGCICSPLSLVHMHTHLPFFLSSDCDPISDFRAGCPESGGRGKEEWGTQANAVACRQTDRTSTQPTSRLATLSPQSLEFWATHITSSASFTACMDGCCLETGRAAVDTEVPVESPAAPEQTQQVTVQAAGKQAEDIIKTDEEGKRMAEEMQRQAEAKLKKAEDEKEQAQRDKEKLSDEVKKTRKELEVLKKEKEKSEREKREMVEKMERMNLLQTDLPIWVGTESLKTLNRSRIRLTPTTFTQINKILEGSIDYATAFSFPIDEGEWELKIRASYHIIRNGIDVDFNLWDGSMWNEGQFKPAGTNEKCDRIGQTAAIRVNMWAREARLFVDDEEQPGIFHSIPSRLCLGISTGFVEENLAVEVLWLRRIRS
ncbi:hypothetical protein BLNAU_9824 [Blattamonas nauphoetae]|uniref:Galectin n=1 Tax=Blattamonas nauphoetae TaxID=2049346 RepID=A0ABQ9XUX7_9EUKA|nr:hypothetical protein BLNAU_9824 [Blattamonas nauphoetae]